MGRPRRRDDEAMRSFVEQMARLLADFGLPRMAGRVLFVMMGVVPGTTLSVVSKAALPYVFCTMAVVALLVAFPDLVLTLPRLLD